MKKIIIPILIFFSFTIFSQNNILDIDKISFEGFNLSQSTYKAEEKEIENNYSVIYSPFLPTGAIYSIKDKNTGKEAIVQIGYLQVDDSPYALYIPEYLFEFFSKFYKEKKEKIEFTIKFLAWNKTGEESRYLNLLSLVVNENNSLDEVNKNGSNKNYIQLGAFSYYQNSYPVIEEMIPYLKIIPRFYIFKKEITLNNEKKIIYRLLAGPYSLEEAREIANKINSQKKTTVVIIHSTETIIKEYGTAK